MWLVLPSTGLELEFGSGLDSESDDDDDDDKDGIDTNPAESDEINTTPLSHQNSQVLECAKVKSQPQMEHLVPPQPLTSTVISVEERWDVRCRDHLIQESLTVKNGSADPAMETGDDITLTDKGVSVGAMQPSTEETVIKISHQPETVSPKGEKITEEEMRRNEGFTSPEPKSCNPEVCSKGTTGEPGEDQDDQSVCVWRRCCDKAELL